jgi:hypothetical protein
MSVKLALEICVCPKPTLTPWLQSAKSSRDSLFCLSVRMTDDLSALYIGIGTVCLLGCFSSSTDKWNLLDIYAFFKIAHHRVTKLYAYVKAWWTGSYIMVTTVHSIIQIKERSLTSMKGSTGWLNNLRIRHKISMHTNMIVIMWDLVVISSPMD